ncbi:MAG: PP2C family protein-serine/threonine phosphatase, partial [Rhodothermia bacterium]|nr:PP2C family protein-serine/threonine phosphatase [Rhodothermia bacterium]
SMPLLSGYDLAGTSSPARSVGGDFFDFVPIDGNHLCFWVGDVAGKGLPAALTMATIQATLRGDTAATHDVSRILHRANRYLCSNTTRSTFVTLFLGILDAATHEVSFGNAGHNRPLLLSSGEEPETLEYGDLVLGFAEDIEYSVKKVQLRPGDVLVVYSDGINEAMNVSREQFGEHRLIEILSAIRTESASNMVNAVVEQVQKHAGSAPQADDLTIAVIKRLGNN